MVAVGPDRAAALERAVDGARGADGESLHAARQRVVVGGLDDQVEVIRLHRVMNEGEAGVRRAGDRVAQGVVERGATTRGDLAAQAKRHVHRVMPAMDRSRVVRDAFGAAALSTGAATAAAALAGLGEGQLSGVLSAH